MTPCVADDHGVIVPGIGPRAPHLGIGAEFRAEVVLDLVALADVRPDPVHDLHVFGVDPADRVGREGPPFAPDADDRFGAGLRGGGEGGGGNGEGESQQRHDPAVVSRCSHHSLDASIPANSPHGQSTQLMIRTTRKPARLFR